MAPGCEMEYDDEDRVREEVQWSRRLFGRHGIRFVDVTEKGGKLAIAWDRTAAMVDFKAE